MEGNILSQIILTDRVLQKVDIGHGWVIVTLMKPLPENTWKYIEQFENEKKGIYSAIKKSSKV